MKRARLVISILLLFLGVQLAAITETWGVNASLLCEDLAKCSGPLGCDDKGSNQGLCLLLCNDGVYIQCGARDPESE
jgi:hypothetical protein